MGREKLYIQAFRDIRNYIQKNNLKPGDLLPSEQTLCGMLNVSRNVLREAIKSMELMGMVESCAGRGTTIRPFSLDFIFQNVLFSSNEDNQVAIHDMLIIRKKLELGYMREAFYSLQPEDVAGIRAILERIKADWAKHIFFHADDRDFHMALFARLNNPTLLSIMDAIWSVDENFQTHEKMKFMDATAAKHESIVVALENNNYEAFAAAMMAHFSSGKYASNRTFSEY